MKHETLIKLRDCAEELGEQIADLTWDARDQFFYTQNLRGIAEPSEASLVF